MSDLVAFLRARLDEDERELEKDPPVGLGYANLPARIHREVEAKRAILGEYAPIAKADDGSHEPEYAYGWADALGVAVRALAAVYRDHPDYDPGWIP